VLRWLDSSPDGLSSAEASARLVRNGPNAIHTHRASAVAVLGRQLRSAPLALLAATAALSFFLGDSTQASIIFAILLELTRAHALAADISRRGTTRLADELPQRVAGLIGQQLDAAAKMWHQVTRVYVVGSNDIADDDELHASLSAELASADLRPAAAAGDGPDRPAAGATRRSRRRGRPPHGGP
jgi:hypothetical protein